MARADELIRLLYMSVNSIDGNPERSHINGLEHSLRVATLAYRHLESLRKRRNWTEFDAEMVFVALVHDLARPLSDPYHGEVIAEIVRDMVSEKAYWVLRTHGAYQAWVVHGEPVGIDFAATYHQAAQRLSAWEMGSFVKEWHIPTLTVHTAELIIEDVCAGRD